MGGLSRLDRKNLRPCSLCSHMFSKEKTQCPSCRHMNHDEIRPEKGKDNTVLLTKIVARPRVNRQSTGPWDVNWGKSKNEFGDMIEGIVPTSVSLIGGAPGAGKSTLCLQMAGALALHANREVLYIAGEEGEDDIDERAKRLMIPDEIRGLIRVCPMGADIDLRRVLEDWDPVGTFVDSLPTIMPDPSDAVEFATTLKLWSTKNRMITMIVDHVTKEEDFAGQMALQHAVDGTFLFTVDPYDEIRSLKTVKNRNGPSGIVTLLAMTDKGLMLHIDEDEDDEDEDE